MGTATIADGLAVYCIFERKWWRWPRSVGGSVGALGSWRGRGVGRRRHEDSAAVHGGDHVERHGKDFFEGKAYGGRHVPQVEGFVVKAFGLTKRNNDSSPRFMRLGVRVKMPSF